MQKQKIVCHNCQTNTDKSHKNANSEKVVLIPLGMAASNKQVNDLLSEGSEKQCSGPMIM